MLHYNDSLVRVQPGTYLSHPVNVSYYYFEIPLPMPPPVSQLRLLPCRRRDDLSWHRERVDLRRRNLLVVDCYCLQLLMIPLEGRAIFLSPSLSKSMM